MKYSDLKDKTVLITGANKGIGKGVAEAFIENGCKVIALYRSERPNYHINEVNKCLPPIYLKADVNNVEYISAWLKDFEKEKNKIDILINNAGINISEKLIDVDEKQWDIIMSTNLKSLFFVSQLIAKHMKKNKGGVIINAASFAIHIPSSFNGIYAASKTAVYSLTKSMAAEWAPYGIRVNSFSPGVVETQMTAKAIKNNKKKMLESISLNRFGAIEEVANPILFLASDSSSYITGTNLDISGGKFVVQDPSIDWNK